jgi:hypothetical protein
MTLLHLGASGWRAALSAREDAYTYLRERLAQVAAEQGARRLPRELRRPMPRADAARGWQASACWIRRTTRFRSR